MTQEFIISPTPAEPIGMALININPSADPAVVELRAKVQVLLDYALSRVVDTDADVKTATEDLSLISSLNKAITAKRTEYTVPINTHLKAVNEAFRLLTNPLEQADKTTREKILAYRREQERRAREAEEINRLRMEAARKEMALKGELTQPIEVVVAPSPPPARVYTDVGTLGTTKTWKYEVIDFKLLSDEYKMVDAAKLGKVIRAGLHTIPGVRIWEEEGLRVSPK